MKMQMRDLLSPMISVVDDNTKSRFSNIELLGDLPGGNQQFPGKFRINRLKLYVLLGYHQHMHRRFWMYVVDRNPIGILGDFVAGNFTGNYFTKNVKHYLRSLSLTSSTIFSSGTVSCTPESISRKMIVLSIASFCPMSKVYLMPRRLAALSCDLILSRPNVALAVTPVFLNSSNKSKLLRLAISPSCAMKIFGGGRIDGGWIPASLMAIMAPSAPLAPPVGGGRGPPGA